MFGEIIKILADEPEKIEKAVLRGIRLALNVLLGAQLYKWIFGPFTLFALNSYADWGQFFFSGKMLICLLFYFISDYLVTPVIHLLGYGLAFPFTKIKPILSRGDFMLLMKKLRIVEYNDKNEVPLPGKNMDVFYKLSEAFADEDARNEIDSLKDTYIGNVLNLYSVFCFIYFFLIGSELRTTTLTIIVLSILLLILLFYAFLHGVLEYMSTHYQEIINNLSFIRTNAVVMSMLGSHGIYPVWGTKEEKLHRCKLFQQNTKEYVIPLGLNGRTIRQGEIERFIDKREKKDRIFLVILEKGLLPDSQELILNCFDKLILIEYVDEINLKAQLKNTIENIVK